MGRVGGLWTDAQQPAEGDLGREACADTGLECMKSKRRGGGGFVRLPPHCTLPPPAMLIAEPMY